MNSSKIKINEMLKVCLRGKRSKKQKTKKDKIKKNKGQKDGKRFGIKKWSTEETK